MVTKHLSDEELLKRLNAHPLMRNRIASLLSAVEDETGELQEADAAEMRVIEDIRQLGQETLTAWANRQVAKTSEAVFEEGRPWREGKKN